MDCERIRQYSPPGGPDDWRLSERSIKAFARLLTERKLLATFFIVPEAAQEHRKLFLKLEKEGFELGMHYHPQAFLDGRYTKYFGEYSYSEQLEQLKKAQELWKSALGRMPQTFRPGNFSANDETFRVLEKLGFLQGSDYIPERNRQAYSAVWTKAYPFPHYTHLSDRLLPGELNYFEIPVVPYSTKQRVQTGLGDSDPLYLRLEDIGKNYGSLQDSFRLIDDWIGILCQKDIYPKTIILATHNYVDYIKPDGLTRRNLIEIITYLKQVSGAFGLKLIPATIEQIHRAFIEDKNVHSRYQKNF